MAAPPVVGTHGEDARWRRLLSRLGIDIRRGENRPAGLLFLLFFLILVFQYSSKAVRQSELVDQLGPGMLPVVYLIVAVCSLPLLMVYSRFVARVERHHLFAATTVLVALSCALFWWLFSAPRPWVPVVFYIWISLVYVMLVSQFWSYSNHVFDSRQAKRLFGFIGAGGLMGGMVGGQVAKYATRLGGTRFSLLVGAAILLFAGALVLAFRRIEPAEHERNAGAAGLAKLEAARGGLAVIRHSRHLQLIALIMLVSVIVAQVVDVQFYFATENAASTKDARTEFYGNFLSITGLFAVVFQLLFTARIHRYLGIDIAMRFLPVSMGLGSAGILLAAARFPGLALPGAYSLKVAESGLRYSVDQSTRELLFLPVASGARLKAKAWIDVFVQRAGKGIAAMFLLPVTFQLITWPQASWISLGVVGVWLFVTVLAHRQYVQSFRDGLTRGVDSATPVGLNDATSIELVYRSLDSSNPRQVINSLDLLEVHDKGHLVPRLLLNHTDPRVRRRTLRLFGQTARRDAVPIAEKLLGDDDPEVRIEAIRTLAALQGREASALMLPRLGDPDFRIRAAAISAVAGGADDADRQARAALDDLVSDEKPEARAEAATILGEIEAPAFEAQLMRLMLDADPLVAGHACSAAGKRFERDGFNPAYAPILISLLRRRRVKHDARDALVSAGEPAVMPLAFFLGDSEEHIWIRRAIPRTLARIDCPAAVEALTATLDTEDPSVRRKVIEALSDFARLHGTADIRDDVLTRRVIAEAGIYMRSHVDLLGLGLGEDGRFAGPAVVWRGRSPSILHRLLADRMRSQVDSVFGLLAALHPGRDIWAAHRVLTGPVSPVRSHALEYLDNTLSREVRAAVFLTVDDMPQHARLKLAKERYGVEVESRDATLRRLISTSPIGDGEAAWLAAAAVYAVYAMAADKLYPDVRVLADRSPDPLVRETAAWARVRLDR